MKEQTLIVCPKCGAGNSRQAFKCQCGEFFDGSAGHTTRTTRRDASVRFLGQDSVRLPALSKNLPQPARSPIPVLNQAPAIEPHGRDVQVEVITFADEARLRMGPASPGEIATFRLDPDGSTNEAAGLRLAFDTWQQHAPSSRLSVILLGDGEPTSGAGLFGNDAAAALVAAQAIKGEGGRIATIGFRGPSMNFDHLEELASAPSLAWEASSGQLADIFREASTRVTSRRFPSTAADFVVLLIDESGSMAEDSKKAETESAVAAAIRFLSTL